MDSNFQSKLQAFSPQPPEGVWEKIADALDAEGSFAERLYQYEEPPPVAAWNEIEKGLDVPAKEVSFFTRFKKPLRYAGAACIIAVALITVTLTMKRTEAGAIEAGSGKTVPTGNTTAENNSPSKKQDTIFQTTASAKDKTNEDKESNTSVASADNTTSKTSQAVYSSLNEYVFFNDGDGKQRRVSKKLADFVKCKGDDAACNLRLQQLRQKLATNAMTTDFTGILEMMRQLQ